MNLHRFIFLIYIFLLTSSPILGQILAPTKHPATQHQHNTKDPSARKHFKAILTQKLSKMIQQTPSRRPGALPRAALHEVSHTPVRLEVENAIVWHVGT